VARFEAARKQQPQDDGAVKPEPEVLWTWHEEESRPVLLPTSLKNHFSEGALVRVKFSEKPDFPFFVRAHTESFSEKLKTGTISILKSILNAASLTGDLEKKAKLVLAEEKEAALKEMVMVIGDTYMSKRDLWQLQLAMMQHKGRLIYRGFRQNFCEHVPSSSIDKLVSADGKAAACGMVGVKTDVAFRSSSTHMFLLIEVSAELFSFGLFGRYYWEVLLECFGQCLERACAVPSGKRSTSHFLRIILFARAKEHSESANEETSPSASPRSPNRQAFTAVGPAPEQKDLYDVIFEGYASTMPPARELRNRVARVFLTLMEEEDRCKRDPDSWPTRQTSSSSEGETASCWQGIRYGELVESHQGNTLECLNLALDHFDQTHLDRYLKISGQVVIILTAGSGLIRSRTRELYMLTNRRCISSGHQSFQIVSVRDPPFHRVPWIMWPQSPSISALSVPSRTSHETEADKLSPFPRWLSFICYQEGRLSPCWTEEDSVKASFLPFIDHEQNHGLQWTPPVLPLIQESHPHEQDERQTMSPKSMPTFQEETALRAFRASSNQKTWDEIRLPRLSSAMSESTKTVTEYLPTQYTVNPLRFGQEEGAQLNLMQDLVGLRLAALGGTQIIRNVNYNVYNWPAQVMGDDEEDKQSPWQVHGNLLPKSLHQLTVQAACGSEWRFAPRETDLTVGKKEHFQLDRDKATSFLYERFFVHLTSRWGQEGPGPPKTTWIESRTVFHLNERLDWNYLDQVLAGVYRIPPALPYPVDRRNLNDPLIRKDSSSLSLSGDTRDGWQLRGALKQHLLMLMPKSCLASSHAEIFRCVLSHLQGKIVLGKDPFDAFEQSGSFEKNRDLIMEALSKRQEYVRDQLAEDQSLPSRQTSRSEVNPTDGRRHSATGSSSIQEFLYFGLDGLGDSAEAPQEQPPVSRNTTTVTTAFDNIGTVAQDDVDPNDDPKKLLENFDEIRSQTVERFKSFQEGLRKLLFGRMPKEQFDRELLDIDTNSVHFTVGRGEKEVSVCRAELGTSFTQSRDWFGFFYDDVFCPPKFFHLVVEWMACSSIHLASFFTKLEKLASEHGFRLLRLPICVLFLQPAPAWVWSEDQETNFDRLPFYPRPRVSFPKCRDRDRAEQVYAKLLEAWLQPPLNLHFIFSCPIQDFKAYPIVAEEDPRRTTANREVYQRLKGWVLCDSDGLALVTLREEGIMFFENHIQVFEARTEERVQSNLKKVNQLRSKFFEVTKEILKLWEP